MDLDNEFSSPPAGNSLTIKEHIFKYLAYWPFFVASIILFIGAGIAYTRYAIPKFSANTLILIKGGNTSSSSSDLIENALSGGRKPTLENELRLIQSGTLMERVVSKNAFNISYFHLGNIRKTDMYTDVPFRLLPQVITDSTMPFTMRITDFAKDGGTIETGTEENIKKFNFKWNAPFRSGGKTFLLVQRGPITPGKVNYEVAWNPVSHTAGEILSKLSVGMLDEKTSIISLSLLIEHPRRGQEILNSLATEFNLADIEDRNIASQNTIRFIDDRLMNVSADLSQIEGKYENFQNTQGMIEPEAQTSQSFGNSNQINQEIADLRLKQNIAQSLSGYFNKPNANDLVPSTLGLDDPTLGSLVSKYNELQQKKQKEAPYLAEKGLIMEDINNQINDVKGSALEALTNIKAHLRRSEGSLQAQNGQYRSFINALPRKTRGGLEITRKVSITEGLYIYLANKREEAAISSTASNIASFKQIEPATVYGPVEPDKKNILTYTALLGLILPVGLIFLKDMINDKINTRRDISQQIDNPIVGEINHLTKKQSKGLAIIHRDIVGEQFRIMRTNLSFLVKRKDQKVILVTSTVAKEGKSFVSLNLAGVLAITGKKVALVEFDIRKPGIMKSLNIETDKGLTDYLVGDIDDIKDLYYASSEIPSLHIYPAGSTPKYPGDLFLSEKLPKFFEDLKESYDYIVIDSAPSALVSDAFILGEYSDVVFYVFRQRYTLKKQVDFVAEIIKTKKLNNVALVLNDVKIGGKAGYFGYGQGYGKKYGYGNKDKPKSKKKELDPIV